jgi:hypothetical protein
MARDKRVLKIYGAIRGIAAVGCNSPKGLVDEKSGFALMMRRFLGR